MPVAIAAPAGGEDLDAIRALLFEYATSLGFSLAYQGFAEELAELPGRYAPPGGALLLARVDGAAAGGVALRGLGDGICEMKRLFVRPAFRRLRTDEGVSIGRALATQVVAVARARGYGRVRLDTVAGKMDAAIALYRSMGFAEIAPYYASPIADTLFLELAL